MDRRRFLQAVATLDCVSNNADSIAELILVGDIVDQWTYPPDVTPPSLQ
ncbi:MAG: hypothetical protein ACO3IN_00045 [Steroidobacteraceae bacterium]